MPTIHFCLGAELLVFVCFGCYSCGGKRTRTADILLAKQALYQLSYTPVLLTQQVNCTAFATIAYTWNYIKQLDSKTA